MPKAEEAELELVITRTFDAPRELVFEAFTNPVHLMKWWGPRGCTVIACETEPRDGGTWSISMRSPKVLPGFDTRYPVRLETGPSGSRSLASRPDVSGGAGEWIIEKQRGRYQEVIKPELLAFTYAFEDSNGQTLHQTVVTIEFSDDRGGTRLTLRQATFGTVSDRDGHIRGWTEAMDRLVEYLIAVG